MERRRAAFAVIVTASLGLAIACGDQPRETSDQGEATETVEQSLLGLRVGDCIASSFRFDRQEEPEAAVVSCTSSDAKSKVLQLLHIDDGGNEEYPDESFFDSYARQFCDRRFDWYYFPTADSWSAGDRTITCLFSL